MPCAPTASALRPFQSTALHELELHPHVICVSPTGSGKTRILEELLKRGERLLVFTPLAALARQQRRSLSSESISIINPESTRIPHILRELKPTLIAVDECHCFSEWGESFRPAFKRIPPTILMLPQPRSLWLTATLSKSIEEKIRHHLHKPCIRIGRFEFPSSLHVHFAQTPWPDRPSRLFDLLTVHAGPGIVFTQTRKGAERVGQLLEGMQHPVRRKIRVYHAGLSCEEREAIESESRETADWIIVATTAFGLGMHLPQLRWVILWQAPHSPMSLAQLAGRAGRSFEECSTAVLLWDEADFSDPLTHDSRALREILRQNGICREESLRAHFEEHAPSPKSRCHRCDVCLRINASRNSQC